MMGGLLVAGVLVCWNTGVLVFSITPVLHYHQRCTPQAIKKKKI
jgi:hypothetical protein